MSTQIHNLRDGRCGKHQAVAAMRWETRGVSGKNKGKFGTSGESGDANWELTGALKSAQWRAERRNNRRGGTRPYWWSERIEESRRRCTRWRRFLTRERVAGRLSEENLELCENELRDERRVLKREIGRAKNQEWKRLCLRARQTPYELEDGQRREIVRMQGLLDGEHMSMRLARLRTISALLRMSK